MGSRKLRKAPITRAKLPSVPAARVALFVEGTNELTPRGRDDLVELWRGLCDRLGVPSHDVVVHGFTKGQILLMDPNSKVKTADRLPLDVRIERAFSDRPFDRLVVAFDALPANQTVLTSAAGSCLASERDFVLAGLASSAVLPSHFKNAAAALRAHYATNRGRPRARRRPPLGTVEIIYMAPCFETLVLADGAALRDVFGLVRVPGTWPRMPFVGTRPDLILRQIVDAHRSDGPAYLRQRYVERKHAWALEVVRKASSASGLFNHQIARRLAELVA